MNDKTKKKPPKPYVKFSTKFVPMGDGFEGATGLQKVLNHFSKNDWTLIRTDPLPNGYMVVAMKAPPAPSLMSMLSGLEPVAIIGGDKARVGLTPDAKEFISAFFASNTARGSKELTLEKAPETMAPILKKYPNKRLRPILENLKAYVADHNNQVHDGNNHLCEVMEIISKVIEVSEKHAQQHTS